MNAQNLRLLFVWTKHQNRMFWRSPVAAFFTIIMPLVMMVIFSSVFSGSINGDSANPLSFAGFFVPAMASFSAASATYTNLAISMTVYREEGILKRVRATPLPAEIYIISAVLSAVWVAFISSLLLLTIGNLFYDVDIIYGRLHWVAIFFVIGVVAFSFLGLALASLVKSVRSAPAATNATILPLAFISGIFFRLDDAPSWLRIIGSIFPLKGFVEGIRAGFDQELSNPNWVNFVVVIAWGVAGFIYMVKFFKWVPAVESGKSARHSQRTRRARGKSE